MALVRPIFLSMLLYVSCVSETEVVTDPYGSYVFRLRGKKECKVQEYRNIDGIEFKYCWD